MRGNRSRKRPTNWRAAGLLEALLADRGWHAIDVERESIKTGHPMRQVSKRSVYRVLSEGYVPTNPIQFEIAAVFGLLPSHIWGTAPMPAGLEYLSDLKVAA